MGQRARSRAKDSLTFTCGPFIEKQYRVLGARLFIWLRDF